MKLHFKITTWIARWWFPNVSNSEQIINQFFKLVNLWISTRGGLWTINYLKESRLLYTRFLCGEPLYSTEFRIGINKLGLPKVFKDFNELILSDKTENIQFVLTLLSISRTIEEWKPVNYKTITDKSKMTMDLIDLSVFMNRFIIDFKINKIDINWSTSDYHYSIKSGPSGLATLTSILDPYSMTDQQFKAFEEINQNFFFKAVNWRSIVGEIFPEAYRTMFGKIPRDTSRRLSIVKDPEGKSRVIAILDYWTQNIMLKLHNEFFNLLREKLPQDRTFTQNPIVDFEGPYHSLDLSAATDRFPIKVQELLLSKLIGSNKAAAWAYLLVGEPFTTPEGEKLIYSTGQPMGAYSSWAIFTFCHHIIVQYSAFQIGEYPTKNYILLGDDIVIGGNELAQAYKDNMSLLGVDISPHKSHTSLNMYEFAKRWFRNGIELSPIQVGAFLETKNAYHLLYAVIRTYLERGIHPRIIFQIPDLVKSFFLSIGTYSRKAENIKNRVKELDALYSWVHGYDGGSLKLRKLIIETLSTSEASIPLDYTSDFDNYVIGRLKSSLVKMFHSLQNDIMNYHDIISSKLIAKYYKEEEINYDVLDVLGDLGDQSDAPYRNSFTFSEINSMPISYSLNSLWYKISQSEQIIEENLDMKEAIKALSIPDVSRLGERRLNVRVLSTTARATKLFKESLRLFNKAWMFEQQYLSSYRQFDNKIIR